MNDTIRKATEALAYVEILRDHHDLLPRQKLDLILDWQAKVLRDLIFEEALIEEARA